MNPIDFTNDNYIFSLRLNDAVSHSIATYGDYDETLDMHYSLMLIYLGDFDVPTALFLYTCERVIEGEPVLSEIDDTLIKHSPGIDVPRDEDDDPLIVSDFEVYLSDDAIFILLSESADATGKYDFLDVRRGGTDRVDFLYNAGQMNPVAIIINDLTAEEHDAFIQKLKLFHIPIVRKEN